MPGSIKIDDGSGNYTILTNAGSLGSDKTITIPNETGSMLSPGGAMFDIWRQTADRTGSATDYELTSNWERVDDATIGFIGTGMSESSGIFTFPQTGIYKITFNMEFHNDSTSDGVFAQIQATTNNSSYNNIIKAHTNVKTAGDYEAGIAVTSFDCTDTTTHKLKFIAGDFKSSSVMDGSSTESQTYVIFERLGDT